MAVPYFKVEATGELLTDIVTSYTYWNMPWGKVEHTPISGGSYLQNTTAATLRFGAVLHFQTNHPTAPLDNYFKIFELEREDAQTVYEYRDVQGWVRNVMIAKSPFGDGPTDILDIRNQDVKIKDFIDLPLELVVPGYLPVELGP